MAIIALMGNPGAGKSEMAALTAPGPVHVIDVDRKIKSSSRLQSALEKGMLTYYEIGDTLTETSMADRLESLVRDTKMARAPKGWSNFANYCGKLEVNEDVKKARTLVIDSYTQLAMHMRSHIQFLSGKSKFQWDAWSTWKAMWTEVTTVLIDYALANDKHLIVILHERVSEKPGQQTGKVMVRTSEGAKSREYLGTMDVRIAGSIEGAFGLEFGSYFTDVYGLRVEADSRGGLPRWICRTQPDNQRDLRCSFASQGDKVEFPPDFREIWGKEWR